MPGVLLLSDERMLAHDPGAGHPERPDRLRAVLDGLGARPAAGVRFAEPTPAPPGALARVHGRAYVDAMETLRGRAGALDPDTVISPESIDAALLAAGAGIDAVDAVMEAPTADDHARHGVAGYPGRHGAAEYPNAAFALVRPPGHHAEPDRAMGFCLFNNTAVAAAHARAAHGLERVLIVDWDVHHGNGTQRAFYEDPGVLFFSTHQWPFYPGTGALVEVGAGAGEGFTVNVPLPAGTGDGGYAAAFERVLGPIAAAYRPQLVLVSAGFDAHASDPLGSMRVTEAGFAWMCGRVRRIAEEHAGGRIVLVLEGGYDLAALASSVRACVGVLAGEEAGEVEPEEGFAPAETARGVLGRYWEALGPRPGPGTPRPPGGQ